MAYKKTVEMLDIVFATSQDFADFKAIDISDVPSDIDYQLKRASNLITMIIKCYNDEDELHIKATKLATCAQVDSWYMSGDSLAINGDFKEIELDEFKIKRDVQNQAKVPRGQNAINDFARQYLEMANLIIRSVQSGRVQCCNNEIGYEPIYTDCDGTITVE